MTPEPPITVYVSLLNDASLSQVSWVQLHNEVTEELIRGGGRILADWYSAPLAMWLGHCFCVELQPGIADRMQETLGAIAQRYGSPSMHWAEIPQTLRLG